VQTALTIPARGAISLQADALIGYFSDSTNAYRFGPPKYDGVAVRLMRADTGEVISEDFHFPAGMDLRIQRDVSVEARVELRDDGRIEVLLRSDAFLQSVNVSCDGYTPSDNYFHLAPGQEKRILFRGAGAFKAIFEALNWTDSCVVRG
jgi:beta-mannosidase